VAEHGARIGRGDVAERARRAGARRVEHVPSVIDLKCYPPAPRPSHAGGPYTIGWMGSPLAAPYLRLVRDALAQVCKDGSGRVRLVGAGQITLDSLPVEVRPWAEATEVAELQQFDVGIMPLPDEPWERGKCGYKLIQYMAAARPVVASPVGVSSRIVEHGVTGFLAGTQPDWIHALRTLRDADLRARMGVAGRARVEQEYCVQVTAPRLASLLTSVAAAARPGTSTSRSADRAQ